MKLKTSDAAARAPLHRSRLLAWLIPLLLPTAAVATVITFEDLAPGTTLSTQYAGLGVVFSPNGLTGANPYSAGSNWATNTDMTVISSNGADIGALGSPSLVSGNILHAFSGWLNEDGDASFAANFSTAITSFSVDFAGVSNPADTALLAYDGASLLARIVDYSGIGQYNLSYSAPSITRVVVTAGSFADWVGVDNIQFGRATTVPEPQSIALVAIGLVALSFTLRRRR